MYKQKFGFYIGLFILIVHILLAVLLFIFYKPEEKLDLQGIEIGKIIIPITTGYAITIIKWIIDLQGLQTNSAKIGMPFIIAVTMIVVTFSLILLSEPVYFFIYEDSWFKDSDTLNTTYAAIEAAFGALLSLIMSDLFEKQSEDKIKEKE